MYIGFITHVRGVAAWPSLAEGSDARFSIDHDPFCNFIPQVRVDDKQDFEINELRSHENDPDNVCRWLLDSARRDFTFNAM